jgi:hypothetical protein
MFTFTQITSFLLCVFTTNIYIPNIPKINLETVGISLFLFASKIYTQIKYSALNLYEKNNSVKEWINYINDIIKYMNGVDIEPKQTHWLSIFCCKNDEANQKHMCNEEYLHIENITTELLLIEYKQMLETYITKNLIDKNTELLFTLKTPTFSLCNIFNDNVNDEVKIGLEKSIVDFINIDYTHTFLRGLERGIIVYHSQLQTPFQNEIQALIVQKEVNFIIADESLGAGVNMPIKSVVLLSDDFSSWDYNKVQQMCGRSGRRGIDREGHIIYVGKNWKKIVANPSRDITGDDIVSSINILPEYIYENPNKKYILNSFKITLQEFIENKTIDNNRPKTSIA